MTQPAIGFVVTLKDVRDELRAEQRENRRETTEAISSLKTSVDQFSGQLAAVNLQVASSMTDHADYEKRLRALERWRYALPSSVILSAASLALALLLSH